MTGSGQKRSASKLWGARVDDDVAEVLHVAMAFEECSAQELLEPVIEQFARGLAAQPEYQRALVAKREHAARREGKLSHLASPSIVDDAGGA